MSYEATLDTDKTIQIASNTGWFNVCDWMEDLEEYPEIAHLVEHGWNEPASDVADELEDALVSDPPDDDVIKTVQGLIDFIRGGDGDATLVISNGMGGDEDSDEEDEEDDDE